MARAGHVTSIKIDAKVVRHSGYVVFQMAGMLRFALTYPKANQLLKCNEQDLFESYFTILLLLVSQEFFRFG